MRTLNASSMPVNATGRYQSFVLPTILLLLPQMVAPLFGRSLPPVAAIPHIPLPHLHLSELHKSPSIWRRCR